MLNFEVQKTIISTSTDNKMIDIQPITPVRFGIVGTNFISDWILVAGQEDSRFQPVAVYSRQRETAEAFARKHNIPHTFTDLRAMAGSDWIDAVYIASPNFLHAEQTILCLSSGKHVLCEKPFASNAGEASGMIETARRYGRVLMEAMMPTLTPNFGQVRQYMHKIGTIRNYFASYCQYSSRYDKFKAGEVLNAFKAGMSNGALMDIGVYTIYPMVILFGKPLRINASGLLLSTGVDGQGMIQFEYPSMQATVMYSKIADSTLPTAIHGEDGTIMLDRINVISTVSLIDRKNKTVKDLSLPRLHNEYYYEIAEFIDLIQSGKTESAVNSLQHSLWTMEIMDEVRRQVKNR